MNRVRPRLIAITGGSGSGKSWLAERLQELLGNAARLSLDAFYLDRSHLSAERRARINYDHPRCIDWPLAVHVFQQLKAGRPVSVPHYDFATHSRIAGSSPLPPSPIFLVEGLWLLRRPAVRCLFDLSIFLHCPAQCRLGWRIARDTVERGRSAESVRKQFCATVAPMHDLYIEPQARHADLVLRQPLNAESVERLFDRIWSLVAADAVYPDSKRVSLLDRAMKLMAREVV
jgi:uridine kinase